MIQSVQLASEPGISLILLTPMKILQWNLNRSKFVVWEMKKNVSVVCVCSAPNCWDMEQRSASKPGSVASGTRCIFLFKHHFLLHILHFLFFFSDNITADVASKQQTTALFLSTTVTRTRHTELTNLMGNLRCAREHSVQFFVKFFYTVKLHSLT